MSGFSWIDVQLVAGVCEQFGVEELWVEPRAESVPRASFAPGFVGVEHARGALEFRAVLSKSAPPKRNVDAPLADALSALLGRAVIVASDARGAWSVGSQSGSAVKVYGA